MEFCKSSGIYDFALMAAVMTVFTGTLCFFAAAVPMTGQMSNITRRLPQSPAAPSQ